MLDNHLATINQTIDPELVTHRLSDAPSKAWKLSQRSTWNLGYYVVWTPGNLTLHGDIDTISLTHYHAFKNPDAAADWVARASFDYFMEKAHVQKVYSARETAKELVRWANEEALTFMKHYRVVLFETALEIAEEETGRSYEDGLRPSKAHFAQAKEKISDGLGGYGMNGDDFADAWHLWHKLAEVAWDFAEMAQIAHHRRKIAATLEAALEVPHEAAEFCSNAQLDDYYGSYVWPERSKLHFDAMKLWADEVRLARKPLPALSRTRGAGFWLGHAQQVLAKLRGLIAPGAQTRPEHG